MTIERAWGADGAELIVIRVEGVEDRAAPNPFAAMPASIAWKTRLQVHLVEDGICVLEHVRGWVLHAGGFRCDRWMAPGEQETVTFYNTQGFVRIIIRRALDRTISFRTEVGAISRLLRSPFGVQLRERHGEGWPT